MATIFEAVVDENGVLRFTEPLPFPHGSKLMVTISEAENAPTEFTLPELKSGAVYRISPRLADPSQAHLFQMEVSEVTDDASV